MHYNNKHEVTNPSAAISLQHVVYRSMAVVAVRASLGCRRSRTRHNAPRLRPSHYTTLDHRTHFERWGTRNRCPTWT